MSWSTRLPTRQPGPIDLTREETIDTLAEVLGSLGYTGTAVRNLLGDDAYQTRQRDVPVHLRRLPKETRLGVAIRLFFLGVPVDRVGVERALEPLGVEELQRLGLLEPTDQEWVRATVRVVPHSDLLLAGDRYPEAPDGPPVDYVATVTTPSAVLANLTVRRPVRTALDLGTGSGVQGLWAARHSERVVAVDVNPRALNLAAFNAKLNGVTTIEFHQSDLFETVPGERFNLILCNAPYVVSPDSRYAFRDSGVPSDGFSERLVREAAGHLTEGGFAHLLIGWILEGDDWAARPRSWIENSGCDCWLLLGVERDPVTHAAVWNKELDREPSEFGAVLDGWVEYLERLGASAVIEGAVILRRRTGSTNWFRADRIPAGRPAPASAQVLRVFEAQDYLAQSPSDSSVLNESFRLVESVRIEQELTCREGGYVVETMTLALEEGLGFRAGIDQNTAVLLPLLDGRPLLEAIQQAAASRAHSDGERRAFEGGAITIVKEMLALGFLERTESPGP